MHRNTHGRCNTNLQLAAESQVPNCKNLTADQLRYRNFIDMRYDTSREKVREVVYQTTGDKGYALNSLGKDPISLSFLKPPVSNLRLTTVQ
ncbi:hypothetical protein J6590_095566 [Homalodisca vitripennis]|nr:hypothetical protein J6590_095566 [Homalodisca vitripennis]